jgi:hypothetical protein
MFRKPCGAALAAASSFLLAGCPFLDFEYGRMGPITWTKRAASAHVLNDVAVRSTEEFAVAVGDSGTLLTSPDGVFWTSRLSGTTRDLTAIAWTGEAFVVAGEFGPILWSSDGITWRVDSLQSNARLNSLASSGEVTVLVGAQGSVRTFTEETGWTLRATGTQAELYRVVYEDGQFVAVGSNGVLMTSPDGTAWTQRSSGTSDALVAVARGGSDWVAVSGPGDVYASDDAATWSLACEGCGRAPGWTGLIQDHMHSGGQFVGVGGATFTSSYEKEWHRRTGVDEEAWNNAVEEVGKYWIAVGLDGIRTSP